MIPAIERFFAKVKMPTLENPADCWVWVGATNGRGYGQFSENGRTIQAHWFLLEKRPTKGFEGCHHCDNRLCVRPSHIFIGTRSDNMRDCVSKGRHKCTSFPQAGRLRKTWHRGSANHIAKLTEDQAALCKACPDTKGAATILAKSLGVSVTIVTGIKSGKRWAHIPLPTEETRALCLAYLATVAPAKLKEIST